MNLKQCLCTTNRTIVELKPRLIPCYPQPIPATNRTIVELKPNKDAIYFAKDTILPIVP